MSDSKVPRPFFEPTVTRLILVETFLTSYNVDLVSLADTSEIKLWIIIKSVLDFMHEFKDWFVRSIKFLNSSLCRGLFYLPNDVEHFRERKLMTRKDCLGKIVEDTITVATAIALNVFPGRSFIDRVRTAAVRTRHLIWPLMFTEIFQIILLVR